MSQTEADKVQPLCLAGKDYSSHFAEPAAPPPFTEVALQTHPVTSNLLSPVSERAVLKVETVKCLLCVYKCISHCANRRAGGPRTPTCSSD